MRGMNGGMRKRARPEADMFTNSTIVISMDDKKRLRSHYQKKHSDNMNKIQVVDYQQEWAAGAVRNLNIQGQSTDAGQHINQSRRRILNDFTKESPTRQHRNASVDNIVNRNLNEVLMNNHLTPQIPSRCDYTNQKAVILGPGQTTPKSGTREFKSPESGMNSAYNLPQIRQNGLVELHNRAESDMRHQIRTLGTPKGMADPFLFGTKSHRDLGPERLRARNGSVVSLASQQLKGQRESLVGGGGEQSQDSANHLYNNQNNNKIYKTYDNRAGLADAINVNEAIRYNSSLDYSSTIPKEVKLNQRNGPILPPLRYDSRDSGNAQNQSLGHNDINMYQNQFLGPSKLSHLQNQMQHNVYQNRQNVTTFSRNNNSQASHLSMNRNKIGEGMAPYAQTNLSSQQNQQTPIRNNRDSLTVAPYFNTYESTEKLEKVYI